MTGKMLISARRIFLLVIIIYSGLAGLAACSSIRETSETAEDPVVNRPTTIQTDEQRQQIYNQNTGVNANPIPKPDNIYEKASGVNKKKDIEDRGTNNSSLTPPEVRPQIIKARTDTVPR